MGFLTCLNYFSIAFAPWIDHIVLVCLFSIFHLSLSFSFSSISDWPPLLLEVSNKQPNRLHHPMPKKVLSSFLLSLWVIVSDWYRCSKYSIIWCLLPQLLYAYFNEKKNVFFPMISFSINLSRFPFGFVHWIFFSSSCWYSIECILCSISIFAIVRNFGFFFIRLLGYRKPQCSKRNFIFI